MRSAESSGRLALARVGVVALLTSLLVACGGGGGGANTVETKCTVKGSSTVVACPTGAAVNGPVGPVVSIDTPTGPNTTEIVIDSGPPGYNGLTLANIPYVTVTLCTPGAVPLQCVTIDHVLLDTGSMGLRIIKSKVASLSLPAITAPGGTATAVECYPFVLGGVWGPLARADLQIGGEVAANLPVQLIEDGATPSFPATADCIKATNDSLLNSVDSLGANGILGVGMIRYDCGQECAIGPYQSTVYYYACDPVSKACRSTTIPYELQVQNPVSSFSTTTVDAKTGVMSLSKDDNGTIIILPAIPETGASLVRGRLVFGIGTKDNNQFAAAQQYNVDVNPGSAAAPNPYYLAVTASLATTSTSAIAYPNSYIDSGSNAMFFDAPASVAPLCSGAGKIGPDWVCPTQTSALVATFSGHSSVVTQTGTANFSIANANSLFSTANYAFSDLAGSSGQSTTGTFVWGLPFFYGRSVFTSIWQQTLSDNGPWWAF